MKTFKIPQRFFFDHFERDCTVANRYWEQNSWDGIIIKQTKQYIWIQLTDEELSDLMSDADYYSDTRSFDSEYRGLCASARATLKALKEQQ